MQGSFLKILPRDVAAYDQDSGINAPIYFTFNSVGVDYKIFDIGRETGKISLNRNVQDDELLQPATLVIRVSGK